MKKKLFIALSLFSFLTLTSCESNIIKPIEYEETYVVIWQNDNGDILEIDRDLKKGTMPTYEGNVPTKIGNENYNYQFIGWSPEIVPVTENIQYTATYKRVSKGDLIIDDKPLISEDKKTLTYGYYPQTHVNDNELINVLKTLEPSSINGWYLYNNTYYAKETAKTFHESRYQFDDKTEIINGNEYYFKVEPIKWNILSNNQNEYYLLSSVLLDTHNYYESYEVRNENIYANNYEYSDIRKYLNDEFYKYAFTFNNSFIKTSLVDNSASTTSSLENKYVSNNTEDKIFLPSYKDYLNESYGFNSDPLNVSISREAKLTDYARIKNAWCNTYDNKYTSSYWTRTPSEEYDYCAINVNSAGFLSTYAVDGINHSIRPALKISL